MPRLYNSANEPMDFCRVCWEDDEQWMRDEYNTEGEEGPDKRGDCWSFNCDHPFYSDTDYRCESCDRRLSDDDN